MPVQLGKAVGQQLKAKLSLRLAEHIVMLRRRNQPELKGKVIRESIHRFSYLQRLVRRLPHGKQARNLLLG